MAINKIIYGGNTLIDLTADTADESTVLHGQTFHKKDGTIGTGECTYDSDTSDANVAVAEILLGKTAYARGAKITGTMPNIGKQNNVTITTKEDTISILQGYHDGSAKVVLDSTEQSKIIAGNIKHGVSILGVTGDYNGDSIEIPQSKTVDSPLSQDLTVIPDVGYTCLSQVVVRKVPYTTSTNSAGGTTVTIG